MMPEATPATRPAFSAYGIELEYMLVDRDRLDVAPHAPALLDRLRERGDGLTSWSNELVQHVVELKNDRPTAELVELQRAFAEQVLRADRCLAPLNARLMPTGMHPWMNPARESRVWTRDHTDIYCAFDRIFDCRRHGWANLQSMQLNLPFADEYEFMRLHAAVRLALPILPALAASSPFADGRRTAAMDHRMVAYSGNSHVVPSITGLIVPESIDGLAQYRARILQPMYRDIARFGDGATLCEEWLNARGAVARFTRNAIEIRVLDSQEWIGADLAIADAVIALVKHLYPQALEVDRTFSTHALARLLTRCARAADRALIEAPSYLALFGMTAPRCRAGELWRHLFETALAPCVAPGARFGEPLRLIVAEGPLARRITRRLPARPTRRQLRRVYRQLCDCLLEQRPFAAAP